MRSFHILPGPSSCQLPCSPALCPLSRRLGLVPRTGHLQPEASLPALELLLRPLEAAQFTGRRRWGQGFWPVEGGHLHRFPQKLRFAGPGP